MKRYGNLWASIITFDNLYTAYKKARLGKNTRPDVARFALNWESELLDLQKQLSYESYVPGSYRQFTVYERKPRIISVAPFRDRVIHHAIMNILEPLLDNRFIFDCYACRKKKGVHRAVDRYQRWANRYSYVLKLDIVKYFPSIDHAILKSTLRLHIKDTRLLALLDTIIDSAPSVDRPIIFFPGYDLLTPGEHRCSIPVGNLTSQFFANLYLHRLDHFIKEQLRVKAYLRYVDDMLLLADSKTLLWHWAEQIEQELATIRLIIHPSKKQIYRTHRGVDCLGYRVFPKFRLLRNENGFRFARRWRKLARQYAENTIDLDDIRPSLQSWIGHASHADTLGLRRRILGATLFRRGSGQTALGA